MNIFWKGQSCFQILVSQEKNNQVSLVIDPFDESIGLKVPKLEANILLITHDHHNHNNKKAVLGNPFLIEGQGEYEIKGIFIQGIPAFHDPSSGKERGKVIVYTIEAEGIRICHLGDLGQKELTEEQVEKIGSIDILMIPVGGVYTISSKEAQKIISQIEPKIVIPMHYQIPKCSAKPKISSPEANKLKIKLEGLDKFLKAMGIRQPENLNKLSIRKKDLPEEGMKVIILKP